MPLRNCDVLLVDPIPSRRHILANTLFGLTAKSVCDFTGPQELCSIKQGYPITFGLIGVCPGYEQDCLAAIKQIRRDAAHAPGSSDADEVPIIVYGDYVSETLKAALNTLQVHDFIDGPYSFGALWKHISPYTAMATPPSHGLSAAAR
ncbi:MAG: hypothetical protein ACPGOY_16700 [Rhodospirillaceae bacterium]